MFVSLSVYFALFIIVGWVVGWLVGWLVRITIGEFRITKKFVDGNSKTKTKLAVHSSQSLWLLVRTCTKTNVKNIHTSDP